VAQQGAEALSFEALHGGFLSGTAAVMALRCHGRVYAITIFASLAIRNIA